MNQARFTRLKPSSALVFAGDLGCFLLFALLGLRSHEDGITLSSVLRVVIPFEVGWLSVISVVGLRGQPRLLQSNNPRIVFMTWLPAWLLGIGLRALIFGRSVAPTFAIIALLVNGLLLVLWRSTLLPRLAKT